MKIKAANNLYLFSEPVKFVKRPFKSLAEKGGVREEEFIDKIGQYLCKGVIRRFGAVLNHKAIGFRTNALVCWQIKKINERSINKALNRFPQVSHCYLREASREWPYNFYMMVHAKSKKDCYNIAGEVSSIIKAENPRVLFTLKELKKSRTFVLLKEK